MSGILVCGANGFIGSHAARHIAAGGDRVVGVGRADPRALLREQPWLSELLQGDLSNSLFAEEVIERMRPTALVFAAGPADVQRSIADPVGDFRGQVLPLVNVLSATRRHAPACRFLLVSSAAVYGEPRQLPVREDTPPAPISPYGYHKLAQEQLLHEFHALYGLPVCIVRPFSTMGPGLRRLAVWDITRKAAGGTFHLPGTGEETRDYLYASDVGAALACIVQHAAFRGEVFNLAAGVETTIRQLASEIFRNLGIDSEPQFSGVPLAGSPSRWRADVSTLRSLGFVPGVSMDRAIAQTVDWIQTHG